MKELEQLNDRLRFALNENKHLDDEKNNESESETAEDTKEENKKPKASVKGGALGIRQVTNRIVNGRVSMDFNWEVDFDTLRKAICDEVMTVDLNKTKKLFKIIKDYISDSEKFEIKHREK